MDRILSHIKNKTPSLCVFCDANSHANKLVCDICFQDWYEHSDFIHWGDILQFSSAKNSIEASGLSSVYCLAEHQPPFSQLITQYKYKADRIAQSALSQIIAAAPPKLPQFDIISAVPMHWTRLSTRGFNQAQWIAEQLSPFIDAQLLPILQRNKRTKRQAELDAKERKLNLQSAFTLNKDYSVEGLSILLVDDVVTTGSTINTIAQLLRAQGAKQVSAITLSWAKLDHE
ncbi:ComF family protein [Catenovulum sediminis]|uniref:ComF family protein n=1 Tax=Catenovulum sediminis TaxID=1740262 RepID=A0ABV1RDC8_9ALTE